MPKRMRGRLFHIRHSYHIVGAVLVMLPLFGCAQNIDLSADPSTQISISTISQTAATKPADAAGLLSSGEIGTLSDAEVGHFSAPDQSTFVADRLPLVRSRPKAVPPFPLVLNRSIQSYIDSYLAQPKGLRESFERSGPFMSEMVSLLEDDGLPADLVYLAFAESAFSSAGAGPWQLNKVTARRYGLTINKWVDERRDPIKSTRAAAEYLAELHDQTGPDWRMTLVAWNNGDEGVNRYLRLMTAPYDRLVRRLPRRTSALMNRFMAVAIIARHARQYGLYDVGYGAAPSYRIIAVDGGTPLSAIAKSNGTTVSALRRLNPALLRNYTPPGPQAYAIRIPDDSIKAGLVASHS